MSRFFLRNLGTKILSLAIGLLVWFFLSGQRERTSERSYRIPLSVINIPPRTLIASALPPGVDVRVRGPFTALRQLEPEQLEAVIDLRSARTGEQVYRLSAEDINVPPEVEVIDLSPQQVPVSLDRVAEKILPVIPDLTGAPAAGQQVVDVQVEPRIARVIGPASVLGGMTAINTDPLSIGGRGATFSMPATLSPGAPGVRVREGQVVTVTVRIGPAPPPQATPAGGSD
ncbi:MAG: YbbR-like domain-containing protein [Thermoanaerobaculia bacterium]